MKARLRLCCVGYIAVACLITAATRQVAQELAHDPATTRTTDPGSGAHDGIQWYKYSRKLQEPATSSATANARTSSDHSSPIQSASCSVSIRGHAVEPGVHVVLGDNVTRDLGITEASITCTTDPPGLLVPLGINETWITPKMVAGFRGVQVVNKLGCQQRLATRQIPIYGLIYFCGDYELALNKLNVQGFHVHTPMPSARADDLVAWQAAILVFGGSTRTFLNHATVLNNSAGSPLVVANSAMVQIGQQSKVGNNKVVWGGCAILMDGGQLTITGGSVVYNNSALHSGGVVQCLGDAQVVVRGRTVLSGNSARFFGGALHAMETCELTVMEGSKVINNNSTYGGGTALKNSGMLRVLGATYEGNTAEYGGGVAAQHSGRFLSSDRSLFTKNKGKNGGAVAAQNMCNITITGGSRLLRNTALYGGVVAVQDNAIVLISGNSYFDGNGGDDSYGGSIAIQNSGQVFIDHSLFVNCFAFYGGVVVTQNTASVMVGPGSVFRNNTAFSGGVFAAIEEAVLIVDNATVENNWASSGGAINLINKATAVIKGGSVFRNNTADSGGALIATLYCSVTLEGCIFVNNHAAVDGGALYLSDTAKLHILPRNASGGAVPAALAGPAGLVPATYDTFIINNTAKDKGGGVSINADSSFDVDALVAVTHGNKAGFDPDVSVPLRHIQVLGPLYLPGVTSRLGRMSGTFDVSVKLIGTGGLPCGGRPVQVTLAATNAVQVLAASKSNAAGVAVLSDIKLREKAGNYTLLITSVNDKDVAAAPVVVGVRHCVMGETTNVLGDACEPCSPGSYSLNPANFSCDLCPAHTSCPGNTQLIPDEGFWHSSVSSPQMHACPDPKACSMNRTELLACAASNSSSNSSKNSTLAHICAPTPSPLAVHHETESRAYLDLLCAPGYSGNLCGNCQPGYGASTAFTCKPCLPRKTAAGLYITAMLAMLTFVRLLTHMTAVDNEASANAATASTPAPLPPPPPLPPAGKQQQQVTVGSGALPVAPSLPTPIPSGPIDMYDTLPQTQPGPKEHTLFGGYGSPMREKDVEILSYQSSSPTRDQRTLRKSPTKGLQQHQPTPDTHCIDVPDDVLRHDVAEEPSPFMMHGLSAAPRGLADSDVSMLVAPVGSRDAKSGDAARAGKDTPADLEGLPAAAVAGGGRALGDGTSLDLLRSGFSVGSIVSKPSAAVVAGGGGAAAGGAVGANNSATSGVLGGHGYVARASDILRDIVLYMQYMVLIGTLRVPWPETLIWPIKALTWFWSASSSQTLSLECLMTQADRLGLPIAITRTLFYTAMPVAVFVVLLGLEALVRLLLVIVPALTAWLALGFRHSKAFQALSHGKVFPGLRRFVLKQQHSRFLAPSTSGGVIGAAAPADRRAAFLHELQSGFTGFGNTLWVLAGTTIFFFLPGVVRYGLSLFVCVPLDNPNYIPYPWTAAAPGAYWLQDLNQACWTGWHYWWALGYGIPIVVLTCLVLPVGIAVLIWRNKSNLHEPWFKRKHGSLYRIFRPTRAAWGAVITVQTIVLVGVAVFGLALGPYHQTLAMSAAFALTLVLLMLFKPLKHKQQQNLLVFGYACLFATTLAALSFMVSFDGTTPPESYNLAMGACVLALNLAYLSYAIWQLKRSITAEQPMSRLVSMLVSVLNKAAPLLPGGCVNSVSQKLSSFSTSITNPLQKQRPPAAAGKSLTVP